MNTKRLLSILLAISILFSSLAVVFYSTSLAIAEETEDKTKLIDAIYIGKSGTENPIVANIFFPLTVNKATTDAEETFYDHNQNNTAANDKVYFKLTFKAKMFSGGIYKNNKGVTVATDLGPVVGYVSYDFSGEKPAVSTSDVQSMRPKLSRGYANHTYSYNPETGICEVVFQPTIKGKSSDNNGIYGAITIGNAEHGPASSSSNVFGETDFDASFIISEPTLKAFDVKSKTTYGDNLLQDGDGNTVGFEEKNVDTNSTFRIDEPDYTERDSMLKAPRYKWHVDTGDSLIEKVKVPADYITSSNYDAANFEKHNETDYTREYYTNNKYPDLLFTGLKKSEGKAFNVIEDINKKMIVISANHEGMPEGSYGDGYTKSNRYANIMLPVNTDQYLRPLDQPYPTGSRVFIKVTMNAKRLEGDGAPLLGRFYGESNVAKTSNYTSYSYNVGEAASGAGNEAGLPKNTYNPDTGEFVGYVRSYANDSAHDETSSGHTQWITIGNGEHKGDHDMFWSTCFNSSFAITDIKVDLYSYNDSGTDNKLGTLIAEDIAPGLFSETIDNENPRGYRANSRANVGFDKYDATNAPQKQWSIDGAIDLVHTYDITKCVLENHTKNFTHTEISSTNLDSWYCPTCDTYFEDNIGVKAIGTTAEVEAGNLLNLTNKMVVIKGDASHPAYLAIPMKLTGFTGHAYFKFSCSFKNLGNNDPIVRAYIGRREGQKGGGVPDSPVPVYQQFDPDTNTLNVIFDVWRPNKSSYAPFFYAEPDTGANFMILIGNSELKGGGYSAKDAEFAFANPKLVRMNGESMKSGEMEGANPIYMAPISDKTVTIDSEYTLGEYESWYYKDEKSPLTAKLNRWYDLGGENGGNITVQDIPDKYFAPPHSIDINNTKATISTFATVKDGETYDFYYDGKFESDAIPKPFVEFISKNGNTTREYLKYEKDSDGRYNFKATFIAPTGLKSSKNIRVGIDVDSKDIVGSVANFALLVVDSDGTEKNILKNGNFVDNYELVSYSAGASEGVWMYQGTLGNTQIAPLTSSVYVISVPKMVTFVGKNKTGTEAENANDGRPCEAELSQKFTVEKGKKYRISFNVKYVNKGYEAYKSKVGAELSYVSTDGEKALSVPMQDSETEYKEIYEFTMPEDTKAASDNLTFTFNFWGAFVSGYIANFSMFELDESGNPIGDDMFIQGDFADGSYTPGWIKMNSSDYNKFSYSDIPENFFSKVKAYTPRMLHFSNTEDWSWFAVEPMLKPNTNYEWCYNRIYTSYSSDKKPYTAASMFRPNSEGKITNTSMSDAEDFVTKSNDSFETRTFKTDPGVRLYGNNNMILRYWMRSQSEGYYANMQLYELDEDGNRISDNLMLNGDFAAGYNYYSLSDTKTESNVFEDIPDGFFDTSSCIEIKNSKATISTFATVKGEKTYTFYYDGIFDSKAVPKPFVDFIAKDGSVTRKYLEYDKNINNRYNFQSFFVVPTGLKSSKNIRIGIDVDSKDMNGTVANFSLVEIDSNSTGEDILKNGKLVNVEELVKYSKGVAEGIWMYEGDLGDTKAGVPIYISFDIPSPKMVSFVGKNKTGSEAEAANDGKPYEAKLSQSFTVKKGKSYRFSFNVKYVNKGYAEYGSKVGAEFSYTTADGEKALSVPVQESETEYRETYEFTMPDDTKEANKNLTFVFNLWGSFVSGQIANFTMYELDDSKNPIGDNLVAHGDFAGETYYPGWSLSNYSEWTKWQYSDIPENFFSKVNPFKNRMLYFHSTEDWTWFSISPMLKPNTNYEWCYNRIYTDYTTDKKPYTVASMFYPNADGVMTNTSMSESFYYEITSTDTFESKKFKTDPGVRLYGGNNMIMRIWMRSQSAGYYGNFQLYELDEKGNRISGNLYTNGGFGAEYDCWETDGTKPLDYVRIVEIPNGFFDSVPKSETMIVSNGTAANATYTVKATVDKYKKNFLQFRYVGMNSAGVTPEIKYPAYDANGKMVYKDIKVDSMYNSDLYYYEAAFNLPADAISADGKTDIKVVFNNKNKGKGYFTQIAIYEQGKYINLITSSTADKSGNYEVVPYDAGVFVFYYDDTKFDDGDWSGELSANDFLISTGNIAGNVVDYDFNPIVGATIRIEPGGYTTKTDKDGYYTFTKLKPGDYKLYLDINGESLFCFDATVEKGMIFNAPEICYKAAVKAVTETVYPENESGTNQETASDVTTKTNPQNKSNTKVANNPTTTSTTTIITTTTTTTTSSSANLPEYNDSIITTNASDAGEIVGIYYSLEGKPLANVKIYITKSVFAVTDNEGRFEFLNLKPNTYKLYVQIDERFYELRDVTVQAQKRISIKVMEPDLGDEDYSLLEMISDFFVDYTLYAVLACIGAALVLAGGIVTPIVITKRKARKFLNIG